MEVVQSDLRALAASGAGGFVFGALTAEGELARAQCGGVVARAGSSLPVTLHRAVDVSSDLSRAVECGAEVGFRWVLTSGGAESAESGKSAIATLVRNLGSRIEVMAGAGVSPEKVESLVSETGVKGVHASASVPVLSQNVRATPKMGPSDSQTIRTACVEKVQRIKEILSGMAY